jgi:hypothetical protein
MMSNSVTSLPESVPNGNINAVTKQGKEDDIEVINAFEREEAWGHALKMWFITTILSINSL